MRFKLRCPATLSPLAILLLALSLVSAGSIPDELSPVFLAKWGALGPDESQFDDPRGVAVDAQGNVFVADTLNHRVQKFDGSGTFLRMWGWGVATGTATFEICTGSCQGGILGNGDGQFGTPHGVAVDATGNVYVADRFNHRVQKFDGNGTFLSKWGTSGTTGTRFNSPSGVAVDASGNVYVADSLNHRISKFSSSGTFVRTWGWGVLDGALEWQTCALAVLCQAGIAGSGDGQLNVPDGIGVDSSGNVYAADSVNNRMEVFDGNGTFLAQWGSSGNGEGQFLSPAAVAIDSSGNVYAGGINARIQLFESSGAFQLMWGWGVRNLAPEFQICTSSCTSGSSGSGDGQFSNPKGVSVSPTGLVYVLDTGNDRIQVFADRSLKFFLGDDESSSGH